MSVLPTGIATPKGFYPYEINQSLRFNDDDSAFLSKTFGTPTSKKIFTMSLWVKKSKIGGHNGHNFLQYNAGGSGGDFLFNTSNTGGDNQMDSISFSHRNATSGSGEVKIQTNALFRDVSAWYHVLLRVDTTQSTSSDRVKIYVNGEQPSLLTAIYPPQNYEFNGLIGGTATDHRIGYSFVVGVDSYFDGYMAEINFIDGQALDPTSFGEFKSGVWVANEYTGTYGTNGFYLPFENGLGDDESGNSNDWTANNLAATDIVLDSPTNNFSLINGVDALWGVKSEANLKMQISGSVNRSLTTTIAPETGKWYAEFYANALFSGNLSVGAVSSVYSGATGNIAAADYSDGVFYYTGNGDKIINGSQSSYAATAGDGDIIGIALNLDDDEITFYKNGVSLGTITTKTFAGGYQFAADNRGGVGDQTTTFNAGQDSSFAGNETAQGNTDENGIGDFYYTPPAGFLALCTANLPEPAISPADDESPEDYFNTVLYTGNDSTQSITGVGFQPDMLWIKCRSLAENHILVDAVRTVASDLRPNTSGAETSFGYVDSLDSDGFGLDTGLKDTNETGESYVAWNWKAGGAGVTNTDGSITSTVSASPESGFSIVSYTGTGSAATVGHGLGAKPQMIFAKNRIDTTNWRVYSEEIGAANRLQLNDTSASAASSSTWNNTEPTSTVFSVANSTETNGLGDGIIAYCFRSVEGYSKFGSYTGNGSSDGPFVYTGFRPAFVIVKNADATDAWNILDSTRNSFNLVDSFLQANVSNSEDTYTFFDFTSNGFKIRNTGTYNTSAQNIIYMAFAENPFKYSLAR